MIGLCFLIYAYSWFECRSLTCICIFPTCADGFSLTRVWFDYFFKFVDSEFFVSTLR